LLKSQSLSGWDGVFDVTFWGGKWGSLDLRRNPFQGGMGFSTGYKGVNDERDLYKSQSLSGWDGVFD